MKSLLEKIKTAKTSNEVVALFETGKTYKFASGKTRRRWHRAANKRVASFK